MFNLIKTALACLAVSAAGAAAVRAEDLTRYENPEFGIAGMVPVDFSAWTEMKDGKGRMHQTPDGRATVAIYGGTIPAGAMEEYKEFTRGAFVGNGGSVTYEANGDDWFVLSGVYGADGKTIFYMRVEKNPACAGQGEWGETTYAHLLVDYDSALRDAVDPLIGPMGKGLEVTRCPGN